MAECGLPIGYNAVEPGPLFGADYLLAYYCSWQDWHFIYVIWLLLLLSGLIWTLGHTAGNYLSPTLAKVCESLNLSYNVAGVTFLAFGNGAPDVFTQVSSFTTAVSGDNAQKIDSSIALIGVNTMLGSSMFVVTIVVGTVAILSPCHVSSKIYLRDVSFHITAVTSIAIIGWMGKLTVTIGIFLFVIYFTYVAVVLIVAERDARIAATTDASMIPKRMGETDDGVAIHRSLGNDLQTAFWHKSENSSSTNSKATIRASEAPGTQSKSKTGSAGTAYTFLVLNDTDSDSENDDIEKGGTLNTDDGTKGKADTIDDGTITLSGGLVGGYFDGEIEEDYVDKTMAEREKERRQLGVTYDSYSGVSSDVTIGSKEYISSTKSPLTEGLLADEEDEETVEFGTAVSGHIHTTKKSMNNSSSRSQVISVENEGTMDDEAPIPSQLRQAPTFTEALYWQQRFLQHRIRKLQASDFWDLPLHQKILTGLEFPVDFVRDITIPTLQQESWYRPYAIAHPIAIAFVCEWAFRDWSASGVFFTILMSCVPAAYIFLTTHRSKPPQQSLLSMLWVLTAFFMCILWFYLLCGELICILESMGQIMNIPSTYLGLTLLAWGNCVGDFFSISALAKRGLGEMAIAGCYASPVFDMLVGLGLSTVSATAKIYPEPFYITLDKSSYTSIMFLYFTLFSSILIISRRGWRLEKGFGYFLYGTYAVYTLVQMVEIM
jgi:Ca2+/Na+ antiporter